MRARVRPIQFLVILRINSLWTWSQCDYSTYLLYVVDLPPPNTRCIYLKFFLFSLPFGIGIGTEAPFRTFRLIVRAWLCLACSPRFMSSPRRLLGIFLDVEMHNLV